MVTNSTVWPGYPRLRSYVLMAVLVLGFGAARLPLEIRLTAEHRAAFFGTVKLNLALREKIGQLGFLAALSGFRTLVADLIWIEANDAWQRVQYGRMNFLFGTVTTLAPRNVEFWTGSSWHMAYNGSVYARDNPNQPKLALRLKAQREYFMLGKDYAEHGIENIPDSAALHEALAHIYAWKLGDHYQASLAFAKAAACPHAMSYEKRNAAYELSYCPGYEREAWQKLRSLYDLGTQERLPTLEKRLQAMEEKLQLPPEQRVYKGH